MRFPGQRYRGCSLPLLPMMLLMLLLAWMEACFPAAARAETLTLLDCLRETAAHNALITQQQLDIERATGGRLDFRSRALPNFAINGLLGRQGEQTAQTLRIPAVRDANGQIIQPASEDISTRAATFFVIGGESLSQPIFDAGIPAAWRRGGIEVTAAKARFVVVAVDQLHLAHTLFLQGLFAQQNGAILREINESLQANAQASAEMLKAGLTSRQKFLAAQVQVANSQPGILAATGSYHSTLATLLQVMGRPVQGSMRAGPDVIETTTLAGSLGEAPVSFDAVDLGREVLAHRPDLVALRETVKQIKEDANVVRAGYYPLIKIYLNSQVLPENFVQSDRPNAVRPSDTTRTTEADPGIRGDWTVIDFGAVRGDVRRIEALRQAVVIALHQAEQSIPSQLALVRSQWTSAQRQAEELAGNVDVAQSTLRSVRDSLRQGLTSQLDFRDAQNEVADARTGLLGAQLQASLARAEFDRVTGGYLRYVTHDPAPTGAAAK